MWLWFRSGPQFWTCEDLDFSQKTQTQLDNGEHMRRDDTEHKADDNRSDQTDGRTSR